MTHFNEVMTASGFKDAQFSGFSASVFKDMGWYDVNLEDADDYRAGKGMGATWYDHCHSDNNKDYFCENHNLRTTCNYDMTAKGTCSDYFGNKE